jgi:Flp pilus assembly protein TadG
MICRDRSRTLSITRQFSFCGIIARCRGIFGGRTGLLRSRSGITVIEFALTAPVMVMALSGMYDATTAYIALLRLNTAAQAIDEIATSMAAGSATTNTLNLTQATTAASAIYAYFPTTLQASTQPYSVVISSVVMADDSGCTSNCTLQAHVAWSGIYESSAGAGTLRQCDSTPGQHVTTQVGNGASPSPTTLPASVYTTAPILVVDVTYTFKPMFYTFITGTIQMMQSAYFPARAGITNSYIEYIYAAPDSTVLCSGYPSATS